MCGYSQAAARSSERIVKILNLYAGIGGNRRLWGDEHEITAVEYKPEIAAIYRDFFPDDEVVVADAHQYLLEHFGRFDFIWSSPPCQTHSRMNTANVLSPYKDNTRQLEVGGGMKPRYPNMALYQEIIFLKHFYRGKWCVENVMAYYQPLIQPVEFGKHWFWTNFPMPPLVTGKRNISPKHGTAADEMRKRTEMIGLDISSYGGVDKRLLLRNCVEPELGKHILDWAMNPWEPNLRLAV